MTSTTGETVPAANWRDSRGTTQATARVAAGEAGGAPPRRDDADHELALAQARLHQLRLAALAGTHYDADEFDAAVHCFRQAWVQAQQAHEAWREGRLSQGLLPTEHTFCRGGQHAA